MKTTPLWLALLCATPLLQAEGMPPRPGPGQGGEREMQRMGAPPAERMLAALTEVLGLTEGQTGQVAALMREQQEARRASHETQRRQMEAARTQHQQQLERLLDERQVALYRAFMRGLEMGRPPHDQGMPPPPQGAGRPPRDGAGPW